MQRPEARRSSPLSRRSACGTCSASSACTTCRSSTPSAARRRSGWSRSATSRRRCTAPTGTPGPPARLGVALTSTGPGAANAMGALLEAHHASSRVLMITGQSETRWLGKGRSTIHETDRQLDMLRTVTRRSERVEHRADVFATVVAVARDMLQRAAAAGRGRDPGRPAVRAAASSSRRAARSRSVPSARRQRSSAAPPSCSRRPSRPLIWAGGGVVSAGAAGLLVAARRDGSVRRCSRRSRAAARSPRIIRWRSAPTATWPRSTRVIADADVVLAVGTRFQLGSNLQMGLSIPGTLIHLDADPGVDRSLPPGRPRHPRRCRARPRGAARRRSTVATSSRAEPAFVERGREARATRSTPTASAAMGADMQRVMRTIRDSIERDDIVVKDSTVAGIVWANRHLAVYEPRTSMRPVSAAIGPGLPLAIGASLGDRPADGA